MKASLIGSTNGASGAGVARLGEARRGMAWDGIARLCFFVRLTYLPELMKLFCDGDSVTFEEGSRDEDVFEEK